MSMRSTWESFAEHLSWMSIEETWIMASWGFAAFALGFDGPWLLACNGTQTSGKLFATWNADWTQTDCRDAWTGISDLPLSSFSFLLFVSAFLNGNNYTFPTWRLHGLDSMTRGPAGTSAWCIKMGSAVEVSPCLPFWSALHGFLFVSPKSRYYRLCYPTPTTRSVGCLEHQTFQVFPEPIRLEIDSWCHEAECSHSIHIFFIGSHLVMESTLAVCFRSIPPVCPISLPMYSRYMVVQISGTPGRLPTFSIWNPTCLMCLVTSLGLGSVLLVYMVLGPSKWQAYQVTAVPWHLKIIFDFCPMGKVYLQKWEFVV